MSEVKVNKITPRTNCGTTTLGDSGDTFNIPAGVTISNNGTATGFGATGAVNWDTSSIKTVTFTATAGVGYFVDTATTGAVTVNLPAATAGDVIGVADYAKNFNTAKCILSPNGSNKIGGSNNPAELITQGLAVTLVYVDTTKGWIVTDSGLADDAPTDKFVAATGGCIATCGNYKVHFFTGPGTFSVTCAGNAAGSDTIQIMAVAGGGGAGNDEGGGGGAGGLILTPSCGTPVSASPGSYTIAVGGGGSKGPGSGGGHSNGGCTTGFCLTAVGGGRGGRGSTPGPVWDVSPGGSGGGGQLNAGDAGTGTQPSQPGNSGTWGFGNAGAVGNPPGTGQKGGGGGGAGEAGNTDGLGAGGDGKDVSPIFGTAPQPFYLADSPSSYGPVSTGFFGGGGAGAYNTTQGGDGGGGHGANPSPGANADNGLDNSGGGGGGGSQGGGDGGNGGSGYVLIRYKYQ